MEEIRIREEEFRHDAEGAGLSTAKSNIEKVGHYENVEAA